MIRMFAFCAAALLLCIAPARAQPQWRAVVVAGDASITVFDNAADSVAAMIARSSGAASVARLSARTEVIARPGVRTATLANVTDAIAALHPAAGQACFVFITSHGGYGFGLALTPLREVLGPEDLDSALTAGCGSAPTVVIASGCFTGTFAQPPMRKPNRVILTAARADRSSFGCAADEVYTVFDACLLTALNRKTTWTEVAASIRNCVRAEERRRHFKPASEPQSYIGTVAADLPVP